MTGIISLDEMDEANETMLEILRNSFDSVTKFNPHHDELGRFTTGGVSSAVADSIIARVKANGGLSVKILTGEEPTDGFMVAQQGQNLEVKEEDFFDAKKGKAALSAYLKAKKLVFGEDQYLGLWWNKDKNEISLDVVDRIKTRSKATKAGRERNQQAIWDVKNQEEINTGGTGDRTTEPTLASSETSKAFGGDDGSGDRGFRVPSLGKFRTGKQRVVQQTIRTKVFKVSFGGDRSEAGRYAANMRWKGNTVEGTGFVSPKKMSNPVLLDGQGHNMLREDGDILLASGQDADIEPDIGSPYAAYAKRQVVRGIVAGMTDVSEEEISEACLELFGTASNLPNGLAVNIDKQKLVQHFVDQWASSSNDSQRDSLLVQQVVQKVFGLDDALQPQEMESEDNWSAEEPDSEAKELLGNPVVEKVLISFVKAQYANTQAYLKSKGITEVMVFRGMNHPELAEELKDYRFAHYERMSERGEIVLENDDGTERDYGDITDEEFNSLVPEGVVSVNMKMRPLSSFSVTKDIASRFGSQGLYGEQATGVFLSAKVPAARIFSTPLTGVGCFDEDEFVVLGGFFGATASASSAGDDDFNYDDMFRPSDPQRVTTYG